MMAAISDVLFLALDLSQAPSFSQALSLALSLSFAPRLDAVKRSQGEALRKQIKETTGLQMMHYRKPLVEKHTKPNSLYDRFSLVFRSVQKFTIKYPLKMARRAHCSMPI